ncbi:helix-turn-helix domain-containing protein [Subtercola sp. PAMC28395]|uniref:helix-turn-helix domain-containing protein n=1 Tax=Subtercola sp. PAMC28395 TaxID=2846775 RepID=UPI00352E471F
MERAKRLDALLTAERWSSRNLAKQAGLVHTYVNRRRNGQADITIEDVELFAPYLKMNVTDLFTYIMWGTELPNDPKGVGSTSAFSHAALAQSVERFTRNE